MMYFNLQLFSGGGAKFNQRGGGRADKDAQNSNAKTYRVMYMDDDGKIKIMYQRGETQQEAYDLAKMRLNGKKIVKVEKNKNSQQQNSQNNVTSVEKSVTENKSGRKIDLNESPLQYTSPPSSLDSERLKNIKSIADKTREKSKENLTIFDKDGKVIYNKEGQVDSVSAPDRVRQQGSYDIHNHPRRDGILGGTFSVTDEKGNGDMANFVKYKDTRAKFVSTKEGTYYIEKTDSFNGTRFLSHMKNAETRIEKERKERIRSLEKQYQIGDLSYEKYIEKHKQAQNKSFVDLHNEYLKNQSRFGYRYGLLKK